jgi:hypothetical protein
VYRKVIICILFLGAIGFATGCGRTSSDETVVVETAAESGKPSADISHAELVDVRQTAARFLSSIAKRDFERAAKYVVAEQRTAFIQEAPREMKNLPPLPDKLEFDIQVSGDRAVLVAKNWANGITALTLQLRDGVWQVVK